MRVATQRRPSLMRSVASFDVMQGIFAQRPSRNTVSLLRPALKVMSMANESENVVETFVTHTSLILGLHHEAEKVPLAPQSCESGFLTHSSDQQSLTTSEEATGVEGEFALKDVRAWGGTYRDLSGKTAESLLAHEIACGPGSVL